MPYNNPNQRPPSYTSPLDGKVHDDWQWDPASKSWYIPKGSGGNGVPNGALNAPPAAGVGGMPGGGSALPGQSFTPSSFGSGYAAMPATASIPGLPGAGSGGSSGGMSDYEKWMLGLGVVGGLAGAYGQYSQNQSNAKTNAADLAERQREYNDTSAMGIAQKLATAPIRDRATYLMGQRLGMNPATFHGETLTQHGNPGGVDPTAMAAANDAYKPGAGGTGPSNDILKKMLQGMGYTYGG